MQATLSAKSLRSFLPRGQTLPDDVFARRHRWMQWILWAHVVAIPLFGVSQGWSVAHSLLDGSPLLAIALILRRVHSRRASATLMAMGLLSASAVLVHLWHGTIEAHFHFFVMIPLLALYEDWLPFLIAVAYVGIHHGLMGALDPGSVYNHGDAERHPWKWAAIHGLFVAAAGGVSLVSWRLNEDMREQTRRESHRRAEAEAVAATLQRGLRPDTLPALTQGTVAARYVPGGMREIGGDWYDVLELPDGRVALTLGDVAGHGIHAASQMAGLRNAARAYAHEGFSPGQVARRIDRFFQGEFATFVYVLFDPLEGELRLANAGHLPPLVISPSGEASFMSDSRSLPLGLEQDVRFEEHATKFPPGATVLVYTDGLVERRGARIDHQLERLRTALSGSIGDANAACDLAMEAFPPDGLDDVAILAFHAVPVLNDRFQVSMDPTVLGAVRERLRDWLEGVGVNNILASDLVLATDEALTNAIRHSGSDRPADVELGYLDGSVRITVRDRGRWNEEESDPDHGRGLLLMDALADRVDVVRSPGGTTVTMIRRVAEATPREASSNGGAPETAVQAPQPA